MRNKQTKRQTEREIERQTDRQTDREKDRQTVRDLSIEKHVVAVACYVNKPLVYHISL